MFKEFEKEAIRILAKGKIPDDVINVAISSELENIDHTGAGYFLTISNSLLPKERIVLDKPILQAKTNGISVGLIVFIENSELTLECHSWGDDEIPNDFRESKVTISET